MKRIPFNLKILDTCLPDYFQGFGGPVIAFPVDARMTYSELIAKLTDDDAWPENADIEDIRSAVVDLVGQVRSDDSRPFHDVGPDEPPEGYFVSRHPTISDMWMVIDKEDGEVMSSWPTEKEALCAAWEEPAECPPDVYAYFGIELDVPEGWRFDYIRNQEGWVATYEKGINLGLFGTEMEAKVAAWNYSFANAKAEMFTAGSTWGEHYSERSRAEILSTEGVTIEVMAYSQEEAESLRDRILNALNAES